MSQGSLCLFTIILLITGCSGVLLCKAVYNNQVQTKVKVYFWYYFKQSNNLFNLNKSNNPDSIRINGEQLSNYN